MAESERSRFRDALRVRDFRVMVVAFALDAIGSWAYAVVMLVYVFERTGSASMVGLASAVRFLPGLVLGPYLGVLGDRYDRKTVMRVSALLNGFVQLGMALVVAQHGPIAVLLLLAVLSSTIANPALSAAAAMRPDLVEEKDLAAANALFVGLESLTVVLGPLLGAAFLAVHDRSLTFVVNAATFFVSWWLVGLIRTDTDGGAGSEQSILKQMVEGITTLWNEKIALTLVLFVALDTGVYGTTTVLYIPISRHLGHGANGFGYLIASFALGGVLVTPLINRLSALHRLAPVVLVSMVLLVVPFALTTLTHSFYVGLALQLVAGGAMVAVDVLGFTALQRDLPREMLSRVMAILNTLGMAAIVLGTLLPVPLLRGPGLSTTLISLTVLVVAVTVLGVRPLVIADRKGMELLALLTPRIQLLEALDLLSAAPRATLEQLAKAVEVVQLEAGVTFVRQGDEPDALWVIVTGAAEVATVDEWGRERVHSGMGPHSYVGEIGLLRGIPRTATVRTTAPSTLWRIPADDFLAALSGATASSSLLAVSSARLAQAQTWTQRTATRGPFVLPSQPSPTEATDAEATDATETAEPTSEVAGETPLVPTAAPQPRQQQDPDPESARANELFPVDPGAPRIITLPGAGSQPATTGAGQDPDSRQL